MKSDPLTIAARRREPLPFAPIIDIHGHCGPGAPFPIFAETPDLFLQEMDRLGVSRLYASSYAGLNGWASHGNADALAFQQAAPGRLFGYMTIDPLNSPAEVDNTLEQAYATGLRMLKIHASMGRKLPYSAPAYQQAFTWADAHNVPVLAHTWGIELPDLEPLAKKHPGLILILAHAGATQPEEYIRLARSYPNIRLDTAFSQCQIGLLEFLVRGAGAEQILWGSDANFMNMSHQIGQVIFADISYEEKCAILGGNAARIIP